MNDLINTTLKIGVIDDPPYTSNCSFDLKCPYRGSGFEMALIVCKFLRLNCIFTKFGSYSYGTVYENGTVTGIVGAVQRGEFDTHLPNLNPTYDRNLAVDFSQNYYYSDSILITRAQTSTNHEMSWSVVYAFHWRVWCMFAFALLCTATFLTVFLNRAFQNMTYVKDRPLYFTGHVLETGLRLALVNEHRVSFSKHRPSLIVSLFWGFCIIVLASAYSGALFSKNIVTNTNAPFTDFETFIRCVESSKCVVVTPLLEVYYILYLTENGSSHGPRFDKAFEKNPIRTISKDKIAQEILDNTTVYLTWVTARNELSGYIDDKMRCSYVIVPMPQSSNCGFPVRKGSKKLLKAFDIMASTVREFGLGLAVKLEPIDKPCSNPMAAFEAVQPANQTMTFEKSIKIPFYFYTAGVCGAVIIFMLEKHFKIIKYHDSGD